MRWQTGVGLPRAEVSYLYSSDFGQTWTPFMFLSSPDSILSDQPDIAGDDNGHLFAVWRDGKYGSIGGFGATIMLRRSKDAGLTWGEEVPLTTLPTGIVPRISSDGAFVCVVWNDDITGAVKFRYSMDCAENFFATDSLAHGGNPVVSTTNLMIHIAYTFRPQVGDTTQIFYRRGKIITTGVTEDSYFPFKFTLFQNYPNPFNSNTRIGFSLPKEGRIRIRLHDITGRELKIIANERKQSGYYEINMDLKDFPSGVYFYRIEYFYEDNNYIKHSSLTKKAVLIK